jgi:hypothetical protein
MVVSSKRPMAMKLTKGFVLMQHQYHPKSNPKKKVKVVLKMTPCTWVILNFATLKDVV